VRCLPAEVGMGEKGADSLPPLEPRLLGAGRSEKASTRALPEAIRALGAP